MIQCECIIIDRKCDSFYFNEKQWPTLLPYTPEVGNKIVSKDRKLMGVIKEILFCQGFVFLSISQITYFDPIYYYRR